MLNRLCALIIATICLTFSAIAAPTSQYTSVAFDKCKQLTADAESGSVTFTCPGLAGLDVWLAEGDLRLFLSYGPNPRNLCVSTQTFSPFNNVGKTLEWRLDGGKPFATIIRYHLEGSDQKKYNFLAVTTLKNNEACHIAYIDGAIKDHNALARYIADTQARSFRCSKDIPLFMTKRDLKRLELASMYPCAGN